MEEAIRLAAGQGHMEVHPEDLSFPEGGIELFLKMNKFCIFGNEFLTDIPFELYGELRSIANTINSHDFPPAEKLMFDLFSNGV